MSDRGIAPAGGFAQPCLNPLCLKLSARLPLEGLKVNDLPAIRQLVHIHKPDWKNEGHKKKKKVSSLPLHLKEAHTQRLYGG